MIGRGRALLAVLAVGTGSPPPAELGSAEPQVRAAIRAAQERLEEEPASAATWGHYGCLLEAHEFVAEAVAAYQRAAQLDPGEFRWPYLLAVRFSVDDPSASLGYFERALELKGDYAPLHLRHAAVLERLGDAPGALGSYRRALELDGTSAYAHAGLGQRLLEDGHPQAAKLHLDRAVELDPQCRGALTGLAAYSRRMADRAQAAQWSKRAAAAPRRSAPDEIVDALEQLAVSTTAVLRRIPVYEQAGRREEARLQLIRLVEDNPNSVGGRHKLGEFYLQDGVYAKALEQFRAVLEVRPDFVPSRLGVAHALARSGRIADARGAFERVIADHPSSASAHSGLAAYLAQMGELELAAASFRRAIELEPANRPARIGYGRVLHHLGDHETALAMLMPLADEAQEPLDELSVEAVGYRGLALVMLRRHDEARDPLRRAVSAEPKRADFRRGLAMALIGCGRDQEAVKVLQQGVSASPNNPQLAIMLARLLVTSSNDQVRHGGQALVLMQRWAAATRRSNVAVLDVLACACAEVGRFDQAVATAREAIRLARARGRRALLERLEAHLAEFEAGRPWRGAP